MKNTLAVFVCLFSAAVAGAQAPAPAVEQPPSAAPGVIVQDAAVPCQGCGDNSHPMPYLDSRWPPLYRPAYAAGDWGRSPNVLGDRGRLTWWFIPTPRALVQAICP
jgi:hypothetical protein